jgi:hypothetical protein
MCMCIYMQRCTSFLLTHHFLFFFLFLFCLEITPLGSSVLKYDLVTDSEDGSGVVPMADDLQTLMDATFEQDEETWASILTFTQKLDDVGLTTISDTTSWLYAIGLPDNQWQGKHEVHGSFFLPLEDHCVKVNINTPPKVITDTEQEETNPAHEGDPDETSMGIPEDDPAEPEEAEPEQQPTEDEDNEDNNAGGDDAKEEDDTQENVEPSEPEQQPTADDNTSTTDAGAETGAADADATGGNGDPVEEEDEEETPPAVTDCSFGEAREIYADKLTLEHYKNTEAGTYTMRLTYLAGSAWVSIGKYCNKKKTFYYHVLIIGSHTIIYYYYSLLYIGFVVCVLFISQE